MVDTNRFGPVVTKAYFEIAHSVVEVAFRAQITLVIRLADKSIYSF